MNQKLSGKPGAVQCGKVTEVLDDGDRKHATVVDANGKETVYDLNSTSLSQQLANVTDDGTPESKARMNTIMQKTLRFNDNDNLWYAKENGKAPAISIAVQNGGASNQSIGKVLLGNISDNLSVFGKAFNSLKGLVSQSGHSEEQKYKEGQIVSSTYHQGGKNTYGIENHPGVISYVYSEEIQRGTWDSISPQEHHDGTSYQFDLSARTETNLYGPESDFKVLNIMTGNSGVMFTLQTISGNEVRVTHCSEINYQLVQNAGTGKTLPAGLWMGSVTRLIGVSDGPHFHFDGYDQYGKHNESISRFDIVQWMKERRNSY